MSVRNRGYVAWVASLALIAFGAIGCGDDDASSDAGSSDKAATTTDGSSGKDAAVEAAAKFQDTSSLEWQKPTEAFDPGTGKVAVISCGNAGINCLQGSKDAQAAAKAMGWTPSPIFDGEFTPAKQAGYVQQAIQQKYDGIILVSIDANSIKAAVDAAAAAKIPIACVMCANPAFEGNVHDVSTGGVAEGEAIGTWVASGRAGSQDRRLRRQVLPDRRRASRQRDRQDRGVLLRTARSRRWTSRPLTSPRPAQPTFTAIAVVSTRWVARLRDGSV